MVEYLTCSHLHKIFKSGSSFAHDDYPKRNKTHVLFVRKTLSFATSLLLLKRGWRIAGSKHEDRVSLLKLDVGGPKVHREIVNDEHILLKFQLKYNPF